MISAVIVVGVITISAGNVDGNAIITVHALAIKLIGVLIVMLCAGVCYDIVTSKDLGVADSESVAGVGHTLTALSSNIGVGFASESTLRAAGGVQSVAQAVFIAVIGVVATKHAIGRVGNACSLAARTLEVCNEAVLTACSVILEVILFLKDIGVIVVSVIVVVSAIGTYVVNGNTAFTVLNLSNEVVAGSTVIVLLPLTVNVSEALENYGFADECRVLAILNSIASLAYGIGVSDDGKTTAYTYLGVYLVVYTVIIGVIIVSGAHTAVVQIFVISSAISARTTTNSEVVAGACSASAVVSNVVINVAYVGVVIITVVLLSVITVSAGDVDSNAILTVVTFGIKYVLVLIGMRGLSGGDDLLRVKNYLTTHREGVVVVVDTVTALLNGITVLNPCGSTGAAGVGPYVMSYAVIVYVCR